MVPFTYTRIWNSRGWSRNNWTWELEDLYSTEGGPGTTGNDLFHGYNVHYPDGRVVKFNKPSNPPHAPPAAPGNYPPAQGVPDRFVVSSDSASAQLIMGDGSVVNFDMPSLTATSIVDPHGRAVTFTFDNCGMKVTEPGGRWICIGWEQLNGNTSTSTVTTSLNQSVTYTYSSDTSGYYPYQCCSGDPDGDNIRTSRGTVTYNDVVDPNTGHAIEAHYVYKTVQPPSLTPNAPLPPDHARLIWASDPMFDGPLQQIKYVYVDDTSASTGDVYMSAVLEERWAPNYWDPNAPRYHDPGVLVFRCEMLPWTYSQSNGNSEGYWTRKETRGDGAVRTISYFNPTTGHGQTLVDHFTDFTNNLSKIERHEYDWRHYFPTPIKITDARQNVTEQNLDPVLGHITRETHDADASYRAWDYTDPNQPYYVGRKTDERGHPTIYTRDPASHLVTRIDYPDGGFETFTYNGFGQVTEHRMTSGGTEKFTYDGRGLKTEYRDPYHATGNPTFRYQYDSKDRLSGVTDARGSYPGDPAYTTNYEYNARNQLTRTIHPIDTATGQRYAVQNSYNLATGTLTSTTDELGHTTSYTYDEYKRVLTVRNPMGETTTNYYGLDWANPLVHTTNNVKYTLSPMNKNVVFDYDANFRKIDQVAALGTADESWTLFEYDEVGNLKKTTDPRGNPTSFGYDARNRKIWMDDPIASDRNVSGHTMNWEYDAVGNKAKETRADNAFRSWSYDSVNRLAQTIDWRMNLSEPAVTTTYTRDVLDLTEWITDAKGAVYGFTFDTLHRKTSETYPPASGNPNSIESFWYDAAGNLVQYQSPAGQTKHVSYDNRNRVWDGWWDGGVGPLISTRYDPASRVSSITTNNGETVVAFGYDDANRKLWEDQTVAGYPTHRVQHDWDDDGNAMNTQVPGWFLVGYGYNQRNQVAQIQASGGTPSFTYAYDAAGNMTKRQEVDGGVNDSTNVPSSWYDALNRPTAWENSNAGDVPYARSHYQFDAVGREVATWRDEQSSKGEHFSYNVRSQLTDAAYNADQVGNGSGQNPQRTVSYDVDPLNRQSVTDNGSVVGYSPDGLNQYTSVGGKSLSYDLNFNLTGFDGVSFDTYDAANRLLHAQTGGTMGNLSTGLDDSGATVSDGATDPHWTITGPTGSTAAAYVTNQAWPIPPWIADTSSSKWISPIAAEWNCSDAPGNYTYTRVFQVLGGSYGVSLVGQMSSDNSVVSATLNGRPVAVSGSGFGGWGGVSITGGFQNGTNVLKVVVNNGGSGPNPSGFRAELVLTRGANSASFTYDGLGRCVKRVVNGSTTVIAYDDWKPFLEWNDAWWGFNVYGPGADEILWRFQSNVGYLRYHHDIHGNVTTLLDAAGNIIEKYTYDAFGQPTISDWWDNPRVDANNQPQSWYGNRFMFEGREWIKELGIYDYRHRMYHPGLGRFLQTDPTGFDAGDMNLYRYCDDDPVDRTDPTGLLSEIQQAIDQYKRLRPDAAGIPWQAIAKAVFDDSRAAAKDSAKDIRSVQGHRQTEERAYAEYSKDGKTQQRMGPRIGQHVGGLPESHIPGPPSDFPKTRPAVPISTNHSHIPGSNPFPERKDVPVANGHNETGRPMIIGVGATIDLGAKVRLYIPTGNDAGAKFHTTDGVHFSPGY